MSRNRLEEACNCKIFFNGQTVMKHRHWAKNGTYLTVKIFFSCTAQDVKRGTRHPVVATALSSKRFNKGTVITVVMIAISTSIVKMGRERIPRS